MTANGETPVYSFTEARLVNVCVLHKPMALEPAKGGGGGDLLYKSAQSTISRGVASSWAWSNGISIGEICAAAGWLSPSTFIRFYSLDVPALQTRVLSA